MPDGKTILYLTYDGLTDPLGQSQILPYLLELEKLNFCFHIISFEKRKTFSEEADGVRALIREKRIVWHPHSYSKRPPVLSAVYDLWKMQQAATRLHRQVKFNGAWCRSYLPAVVGMHLKNESQLPFIFDMRGFWPDERVEGGSWNLTNPLYKAVYAYFKRKEKQLLSCADHVVVLTHAAKKIIQEGRLGADVAGGISVIPCCVDVELFNPEKIKEVDKEQRRLALGIGPSNKVLVYCGSLGTWYLVKEMLEYFASLWERDRGWIFLFVTKDNPATVWKHVKDLRAPAASIRIAEASRMEVPLYLSLGNLALSFIMPSFSKQASSPTKLAEYMSMGLPVVCNVGVGDVEAIIQSSEAGCLVDISQSNVLHLPPQIDLVKVREAALALFSLQNGVKSYQQFLGD